MENLFKEAKTLFDQGLEVHWLHPKSKKPIETDWTRYEKKPWKKLASKYMPGMNLGVKLGAFSQIKSGAYLAVIDCDVKSEDPKDREELESKLKELFPELNLDAVPQASSGRGNGSKHIYVSTKEPQKPRRLAQASRNVKVLMPSSGKPSARDMELLTASELSKGYRVRPAWEISFMGQGQQVVLPPSLHPDTGSQYTWKKNLMNGVGLKPLPLVDVSESAEKQKDDFVEEDFKVVEFDFLNSTVSDRMVDLITTGKGCSGDKSASMFAACLALHTAGHTEDEILSVLTDKNYYLGAVGYNHAQTKKRSRAAKWVKKYCLDKAIKTHSDEEAFESESIITPTLSSDEAKAQEKGLFVRRDWRDGIERTSEKQGSKPKNTAKNVVLILSNVFGEKIFARNEFAGVDVFGCDVVLPHKTITKGSELRDIHIVNLKLWLSEFYRFEPSNDRIDDAIREIADKNKFHPVREYLKSLVWDGTPRLDTWLKTYMKAEGPESYVSAVGRKALCAMVARVLQPGIKFDQVLILEGEQGVGKSTVARVLASDKWFTDATINVNNKDAVLTMGAVWVVELGELSSMKKADVDHLKEFISRTEDRIRLPYGKKIENFPRQCIFIGTTNNDDYLRDATGNRRFWPIKVGVCDISALTRDRDQLFAEAMVAYDFGEALYLDDKEVRELAKLEQEDRVAYDPMTEILSEFFDKEEKENPGTWKKFVMNDLFKPFGPLERFHANQFETKRAGIALRKLGFQKVRFMAKNKRDYYWISEQNNTIAEAQK